MITPGKREREKKRREKHQNKTAVLAQRAQTRQDDQSAEWPPRATTTSSWPEGRTQAVINELVEVAGDQPDTAVRNCIRKIAANPADIQPYRVMGQYLLTEGATEEALKVFEVVVREFPHHPLGPWKSAVCLRTSGDMAGSREWMQRAWRRAIEMPRAVDPAEREEFERDARLAGLAVPN